MSAQIEVVLTRNIFFLDSTFLCRGTGVVESWLPSGMDKIY